uniref:Uncharacterized protein n=1 Tax=viral metagenome TaxID=1070528 RepID=A0A6H1ZY71_9ZZZZ
MAYNLKDYLPTTNFGSGRTFSPSLPLIDGVTATSTSSTLPAAIMAKDFNNVVFAVETTGNANATIKFTATTLDSPHDPTTTSTITNQWAPIQVIDLSDGTSYDGTTGIVISGTDVHKMFEANISSLSWIRPMVSSYTTGTIYVYGIASTNQ